MRTTSLAPGGVWFRVRTVSNLKKDHKIALKRALLHNEYLYFSYFKYILLIILKYENANEHGKKKRMED